MIAVFLILELLCVIVGVLMGMKRGMGRTIVRAVYLLVIGAIALIAGRSLAASVTPSIWELISESLPEDVSKLLSSSPDIGALVEGMLGAIMVPVIFALIFAVLKILTLIGFKSISKLFVRKDPTKASRAIGAALGVVTGFMVASVLLAPMFTAMTIVANTPDETKELFVEIINNALEGETAEAEEPEGLLMAGTNLSAGIDLSVLTSDMSGVTSLFPLNKLTTNMTTSFDTPAGENASLVEDLPKMLEAGGSVINAYQKTMDKGGSAIDAIANAGAVLNLYMDDSPVLKELTGSTISAVGKAIKEDGEIFGQSLKSDNAALNSIIDSFADTLINTNGDNLKTNLQTMFGDAPADLIPESKKSSSSETPAPTDDYTNNGVLATISTIATASEEELASNPKYASMIADTFSDMILNENMSGILSSLLKYASDLIIQSGVDVVSENFKPYYDELCAEMNKIVDKTRHYTFGQQVDELKDTAKKFINDLNLSNFSDWEISAAASCIVLEFWDSKYSDASGKSNVAPKDIMTFFDLDVPEWAK